MKHAYRSLVRSCVLTIGIGCGGDRRPLSMLPEKDVAAASANAGVLAASGSGAAGREVSVASSAGTTTVRGDAYSTAGLGAGGVTSASGDSAASGVDGGTSGAAGAIAAGTSGSSGHAGTAVSGSGGAVAGVAAPSGAQALPAVADYAAAGPFKTVVEANQGPNNNYTVYRPEPLGTDGFRHSPIIFGPGIATSCAPGGGLNIYTDLLNHFSSHGFVTICVNSMSGGPNAPGNLSAMRMGLDWLLEQNEKPGVYQANLASERAVSMGYSIGATASTQLSSHKAIMTVVSIHGHNTEGDPHGPIWLITGTMDVIADNRATLATLTEAPALLSALPIGHLDVVAELRRGGRYVAPLTAWLRYWVNEDQGAKRFFLGTDCETCKTPWIAPESNAQWKALN